MVKPKNILNKLDLFKSLSKAELKKIINHSSIITLKKNKVLFKEKQKPEFVYVLIQGRLDIVKIKNKIKKIILNTLHEGELCCEESFLTGESYKHTGITLTAVELIQIEIQTLKEILYTNPQFTLSLSLGLCNKLQRTHQNLSLDKKDNKTITIYNKGDRKHKAWLALELAVSLQEQTKQNVLLLDLATQHPSISDILNWQKPYDYIVINLPPYQDALSEKILEYSTNIINISSNKIAHKKCLSVAIPHSKQKKEWLIGHLARKISNRTIGLALGSGTTGGLTHIGLFKALEKLKIPIDMIAGTSGGALYGSMLAAGLSAKEIEKAVLDYIKEPIFYHFKPSFSLKGFFTGKNLIKDLYKLLKKKYFSELIIPFHVVATDLKHYKRMLFSTGSFLKAIEASISIPVLFNPKKSGAKILSDGAAIDPIPVDVLKENKLDLIIASYPSQQNIKKTPLNNVLDIYLASRSISNDALAKVCGETADIFINPDTSKFGAFEYKKAKKIISLGEIVALNTLSKKMKLL